jgi:DNA-binding response OmpR family regulator
MSALAALTEPMPDLVRPGRIMVVEDERHIARLLDFVLRKAGYELSVANSAEKAFEEIEAYKPDALLLDLVLPGMSGLEFLRVIRAKSSLSKCVVIVLSGHWFEHTDATLAEAGASAQCSKPIAPSTLLRKLRELSVHPTMPQPVMPQPVMPEEN